MRKSSLHRHVSLRLLSALVIVALLLPPLEPRPAAAQAASLPEGAQAQASAAPLPSQGRGDGGVRSDPQGFLRFSPDVDADGDPATNPNALTPVPVGRVLATGRGGAVKYALVALAVEAVPQIAARNPAGVVPLYHPIAVTLTPAGKIVVQEHTVGRAAILGRR